MLWIVIVIGLLLVIIFGIFLISLCVAARKGDKQIKAAYDERLLMLQFVQAVKQLRRYLKPTDKARI
jgi:hypothetical protein